MMFGTRFRRLRGNGGNTPRSAKLVALTAALMACLMAALLTGGCGGSGDGGNNGGGNNGTNTSKDGILTGVVLDRNNNDQPVVNARITFGDRQTTTGNDGRFSLAVPSNKSGLVLTVAGPALQNGDPGYYNSGFIGQTQYQLGTAGFPVGALASQQQLDLGTILIFGVSGPPPPPLFP